MSGSTQVGATVSYDVSTRIVTLDPTANLTAGTTYTATLSGAQDLSGNTMSPVSWSFTTAAANTTPPTVSAQSPASGAIGVVVASDVTATFSESVQAGTISFVLKNGGATVASTTSYDVASHIVTLDPSSNLALGTTYTVTLSGAKDLWGNTMASTSWSFTTATADTTAPTVTTRTPAPGRHQCSTGQQRDRHVQRRRHCPATISFVGVKPRPRRPVAVRRATYDVASRTVTLDPTANLATGTTYTVTLSGAQDLSGNTMTSASWSFTTVAAVAAPTVSAQTPASGATGVVVASNVAATFSEDVQPGTISFVLKAGTITVPATVTYDVSSRIVTLDPTANLSPGTTYTVTLSGAQNLAGTAMTLST